MRRPRRLDSHPRTAIARGAPVTFRHEGRAVSGFEGETVAAALYAAGHVVLSRSMRYHRPRGLYCGTGGCTHCFLRIDGVPNQRACQEACTSQTWSEGQNAWPSVERDVLAGADVAFPRYLDAHRSFTRPAPVRWAFHAVARRMAGFGRVPAAPVAQSYRHQAEDVDVLVVGAGAAGLAAAAEAAKAGARVLVAEARPQVGGRLRHTTRPFAHARDPDAPRASEGKQWADEALRTALEAGARVETGLRVFGSYEDGWRALANARVAAIRARAVVLANGNLDAPCTLPNADRAGLLLPTAAATLLNVHGIALREPVAVLGTGADALALGIDLAACGVALAGVFGPEETAVGPAALADEARTAGVPLRLGWRPLYVAGTPRAGAVVFDTPQGRRRVRCGSVVADSGRTARSEFVQQAGGALRVDDTGVWPVLESQRCQGAPRLWVAGGAAGAADAWESVRQGRAAGAAAGRAAAQGPIEAVRA